MEKLTPNQYRCSHCHKVFEKGWTEEEAAEELSETFGDIETPDCDIVCDDCYNKIMGIGDHTDFSTIKI